MARVNMLDDAPGGDHLPPEGIYPIRVAKAEERKGKKPPHNRYFGLQLVDDRSGEPLAFHTLMLEGKGWGYGKAALIALGIDEQFNGELVAAELIGRRAWAALKFEVYDNQRRLAVDIEQGKFGWWPWGDPPMDAPTGAAEIINAEDTPF